METQKRPYKDYSPLKRGLYMGFHVSLGEGSKAGCRIGSHNCRVLLQKGLRLGAYESISPKPKP